MLPSLLQNPGFLSLSIWLKSRLLSKLLVVSTVFSMRKVGTCLRNCRGQVPHFTTSRLQHQAKLFHSVSLTTGTSCLWPIGGWITSFTPCGRHSQQEGLEGTDDSSLWLWRQALNVFKLFILNLLNLSFQTVTLVLNFFQFYLWFLLHRILHLCWFELIVPILLER